MLIRKLANGGLTARNENASQLEIGHILKTLGQLYEFRLVDKFHLEFETYISLNGTSIKSKTSRARVDLLLKYQDNDNITYAAIELKFFKKENHIEPNHSHYCDQINYSLDTSDFDFRDEKKYKAGTVLQYKTTKPYGDDLSLKQDYDFKWDKINDLYFLKLNV